MKNIDITMIFKRILFFVVITLIFISIISIFFVFIQASKYQLQVDYDGFKKFIELFTPFNTVYASTVVLLSAYIAFESLYSGKTVEEGKAILELKKLFNTPELREVNENFRPITGKWNNDNLSQKNGLRDVWPQVEAYIETFEFANTLIDTKIISLNSFKDHFGHPFKCLIENDKIRFMLGIGKERWINFKELCNKMEIDLKTYEPQWDLYEKNESDDKRN